MIDLQYISGFYDQRLIADPVMAKHALKEYVQLMTLDYLSSTPYARKLAFIGGTNLRLIKRIDRFSEDLDFDVSGLSPEEFTEMTNDVVLFLRRSGFNVETHKKESQKLTAFRRNIYFPQLLFDLRLTGHKEERFLLKIEAQDQGVGYEPKTVNVSGCGFFFPLQVPPDGVLLSMKIAALLARAKGRDFYDVMFLMAQTQPDYDFLVQRAGFASPSQLLAAVKEMLAHTDLSIKKRDFEHLLFNRRNSDRILSFGDFIVQQLG